MAKYFGFFEEDDFFYLFLNNSGEVSYKADGQLYELVIELDYVIDRKAKTVTHSYLAYIRGEEDKGVEYSSLEELMDNYVFPNGVSFRHVYETDDGRGTCQEQADELKRALAASNYRDARVEEKHYYDFRKNIGSHNTDKYGMPLLRRCLKTPGKIIPFNIAMSSKNKDYDAWVHFFIDDKLFERVWNYPARYIAALKKYKGVIAPDFSLRAEDPLAVQTYNCYRNMKLAAMMQDEGIDVIPVIEWSDKDSFEWCLNGLPLESVLAVQTNGCFCNCRTKIDFFKGMEFVNNTLRPKRVIVYGRGREYANYFKDPVFFDPEYHGK